MKKDSLVTFRLDDFVDDIRKVMAEKRHRDSRYLTNMVIMWE